MSKSVDVVVTFLEMLRAPEGWPGRPLPPGTSVHREPLDVAPRFAAEMYRRVGGPWHWLDRLGWSPDDWRIAIDRPGVEIWRARADGETAGYYELSLTGDVVDIRYFGLVPGWTGRGIGGPLLDHAVRRAWELGPRRVTVNTCTLDHPVALANYRARGFAVVRTERQRRRIP
ncbi:MAG: GNAT family N-acetyltransferase [Gemmatimonadales bacterium]